MNVGIDIKELNEKIQRESEFVDLIQMEVNKVIVGQKHLVDSLLISLLSNVIFCSRGVPGLAKPLHQHVSQRFKQNFHVFNLHRPTPPT
jgi:MoxR-like ATPase